MGGVRADFDAAASVSPAIMLATFVVA